MISKLITSEPKLVISYDPSDFYVSKVLIISEQVTQPNFTIHLVDSYIDIADSWVGSCYSLGGGLQVGY